MLEKDKGIKEPVVSIEEFLSLKHRYNPEQFNLPISKILNFPIIVKLIPCPKNNLSFLP